MAKEFIPECTSKENPESTIMIGIAETAEEREKIFRFRYRIYAEEMGKNFPCMNHDNKLLYDVLDDWSLLLYAKNNSDIVGTLRVTIGEVREFPEFWVKTLSLNRFLSFITEKQKITYASKFMIEQSYRNSTVPYLLAAKSYELSCNSQVRFAFCVANFHLSRFYEQLGFHRYGRNFMDTGYGLQSPFVLLVDDIEHLRAVRSPFFRLARKRTSLNQETRNWFYDEFPESLKFTNSQLVSEDNLCKILSYKLKQPPTKILPILHGLSEEEAKKFLHHCGVIIHCQAGDHITVKNDASYSLYTLLSGKLRSPDIRGARLLFKGGSHFGAEGLVSQLKHQEDIFAATNADILILTSLAFPKFRHSNPDTAEKILYNLQSIYHNKSWGLG